VERQPVVSRYVIVAVPVALAVKVLALTDATVGLPLLHNPPVVESASDALLPTQSGFGAMFGTDGFGLTVMVIVTKVESTAYVIILVPAEIPVTTPLEKPTVATEVSLLIHTPPEVVSLKEVVDPTQT